jgi:hypothetical protein
VWSRVQDSFVFIVFIVEVGYPSTTRATDGVAAVETLPWLVNAYLIVAIELDAVLLAAIEARSTSLLAAPSRASNHRRRQAFYPLSLLVLHKALKASTN